MKFNAYNLFQLALLSSALLAPSARAADGTWIGAGGDTLWSNPGNWSGGVIATGSDATADFGILDLSGDVTVNLNAPRTLGNLTFGDTDPTTVGGWTLANNGSSSNILTLSGTTTPVIAVNSLGTGKFATISATLAGAGFTKTGAGTLVLAGANSSYTGGIALNQGTLVGTVAGAFGSSASTVAFGGGNLELRGDSNTTFTAAANLVTSGGTITVNRATSAAIATTHTLGPVAIGSQQLSVAAGGNITSETPYGLTLGATTLSGDAVFDVSNNGAGVGTLTLGAINTDGAARTITKQGAGTLKLNAASGAVAAGTQFLVNNGVLVAAANGAFSNTADTANTTTIVVNAGGELQGTAQGAFRSSGTGTPSEAINLSGGTLRLVAYASSYTYFYGDLTYNSGGLIINGTTLNKPFSNNMGTLSIGSSTLAPIAVDIATPTLYFAETTLTGNPAFDTSQVNISLGALDDGGTARVITKQGTGNLILAQTATSISGGTQIVISGGTVVQNASNALGTYNPTLVIAPTTGTGAYMLYSNSPTQSLGTITLGGGAGTTSNIGQVYTSGVLTLGGNLTFDATLHPETSTVAGKLDVGTSQRTFDVGNSNAVANDLIVSAVITNGVGGSILKAGAGTLVLSGENKTYTGGIVLNEGTLVAAGGYSTAFGTSASTVTEVDPKSRPRSGPK